MPDSRVGDDTFLEMQVYGFALDAIAQMPVIILKDASGEHTVPVWVNAAESVAFAAEFVGREISVRSGRKDLFTSLLERLEMKIVMIAIDALNDGLFSASVRMETTGGEELCLDLHVSEAMLLSLKYRLPVMVKREILGNIATLDMNEEDFAKENNARRFVDFLDQLDPSTMGKYPM
ncbi:bifunctional nuclease family protein [Geomonas sp. RF6]|uniref:bifunctional nuclease family protein n=1 Tax=Geomonas sp. RF6 TaxID=2897342 RepID=UPI001E6020CD|nr:bifunctional nuclease family protein [Geomonas sp. RF6]UFS68985.1 bifunctional nuclease family protein [Geomonas sp. RF6]